MLIQVNLTWRLSDVLSIMHQILKERHIIVQIKMGRLEEHRHNLKNTGKKHT